MRIALALALALLSLIPLVAEAQLASPGDLARPHAKLEGMGNCSQCHPAGGKLSAERCLDCHKELGTRIAKSHGFHGRLHDPERSACQECHHEHQGRDTALIDWGGSKQRFDHNKTGWALRGRHVGQACDKCHEPRRVLAEDILALLKQNPKRPTYLGVGTKCTTCHFDEHRGQTKDTCESCHTESAWKPAPKFNHADTKYPLAGSHKSVACAKCHDSQTDEATHPAFPPPRANTFLKYAPLAHARCTDCHQDPHNSRFGPNCEGCHTVESWHTIRDAAKERGFHDKTRFPLKGLHALVGCPQCHGPSPEHRTPKFKGLAHDACMDCHSDAHLGQLSKAACERCHSVDGFRPARFEIEQHAQTRYPLEGAHLATPCNACHRPDPRLAQGKQPAPATVGKPAKGKKVHIARTVHGAREQRISTTAFKLNVQGDHCESCHKDPHAGQFKASTDGCKHCHNLTSWKAVAFEHNRDSRFALTGKHSGVACAGCHPTQNDVVRYKPLDTTCAACHRDAHLGQFAGTSCETCHTVEDFAKTLFRHDDKRFTSFALDGKHVKVPCAKCHTKLDVTGAFAVAAAGGEHRMVTRYRPLPRACEACHSDPHHGAFRGFEP